MRALIALAGITVATALVATPPATATAPATAPVAAPDVARSCRAAPARGHLACFALRRTDLGFTSRAQLARRPDATPSGYAPSDLQSAYTLPSASAGSGRRVYIVDAFDDPNAEADLAVYRGQYGLPACTTANGCFQKLNQSGATSPLPNPDAGWAGEISLDLDMASAVCPKCGITLVEANDNANTNLFTAVKQATTLGAKYVSMSFGGAESSGAASLDSTYLLSSGVVYTASTGDNAYAGGMIYPAASPLVVAVGGTSLNPSTNSRGWTESVWRNDSAHGTGSGCSAFEAKPAWQDAAVTSATCPRRADADVSAVADPATGVAVYQTYGGSGWAVYGGTSASAPIVASVYALAGTPGVAAKPPSYPYAHTSNLFDVTTGNNGTCSPALLCTAATGWDGPTGLGTPNGIAAFRPATGNTVTVTNPGGQTGKVGTAKSLQISATDSAGLALTYSATGLPPGLTITATSGLISGTPTTTGTYSVKVRAADSTNASGSATFTWTITPANSACTGQKLLNPGFESGSASWTATAGVISTDGLHSRTGSGYAFLNGYGTTHTDTLAQAVALPSGCTATLTYYLWVSTDEGTSVAHDKLTLTANGSAVQGFSNRNASTGYVKRTLDLSSYAGQTVTLKWTGKENTSVLTAFLIDDAAVALG